MKNLKRLLMVFLLVLVQFSCTRMVFRYIYNSADTFIIRKVDEFFNINDNQKAFLKKRLKPILAWHKETELQNYIQFLENTSSDLRDGISSAEFDQIVREVFRFRDNIYMKTIDDSATFLSTLSNAQIKFFEKALRKNLKPLEKKIAMPRQERLEERAEKTIEQVNKWYGSLSDEQEKKIKSISKSSPEWTKNWITFRKKRQAELLEVLRSHPGQKAIRSELNEMMLNSQSRATTMKNPRTRKFIADSKKQTLEIDALMTQKQRDHLAQKLSGLAADLRYLQK